MSTAEKKYSAFDRELLALYLAVKHFRSSLEGRPFTIYTDHKPLCGAITSAADHSPRQTRHLSFVAEYTTDIRHVSGEANVVADALSRPSDVPLSLDDVPDALVLPALSSAVNALRLCPGVDFVALSASQSAQSDLLDTTGSLRVVQLPIPGTPDTKPVSYTHLTLPTILLV